MKNIETKIISNNLINKYLFYKNLPINRLYSSNKFRIRVLDHYLWWFNEQKKRRSILISKNKKPLFISTTDHFKVKNKKFIYSGLLSCMKQTNLFDFLTGIKVQNIFLNKQKNSYCFISIHKKNKVLMFHWKYFGYRSLKKTNKLYYQLKQFVNLNHNLNVFYKKT
jgi:hypothetical protein